MNPSQAKSEILKNYIHYRSFKRKYQSQNFWLIISSILLVMSASMLTVVPWVIPHYFLYGFTSVSILAFISVLIRNKGIILPKSFSDEKCRYYQYLDDSIDDLVSQCPEHSNAKD